MSGHSKWSTIKRQKGLTDAKRSSVFTKLAKTISIAARDGGGDATANFRLRLAIDKARAANMPKDNIDRAVQRGTGELGGAALEELTYEAYGPGGIAILIEVTTDNRNRAIAEIKALLTKYNGKLATTGAVGYLFHSRGSMTVSGADAETIETAILESGADDYAQNDDNTFVVYTQPKDVVEVSKNLETAGLTVADLEVAMEPTSTVKITEENANAALTLLEYLDELDDVSSVVTNLEVTQ